MYKFLDIFFVVFHTGIIFFNLFGWIWKRTRRWNLFLLVLTGLSWTALSLMLYGSLGYCPVTDWHWDVLRELGQTDLPNSYVKYLADRLTGWDWNAAFVDSSVLVLFLLALGTSLALNIRDWKRK